MSIAWFILCLAALLQDFCRHRARGIYCRASSKDFRPARQKEDNSVCVYPYIYTYENERRLLVTSAPGPPFASSHYCIWECSLLLCFARTVVYHTFGTSYTHSGTTLHTFISTSRSFAYLHFVFHSSLTLPPTSTFYLLFFLPIFLDDSFSVPSSVLLDLHFWLTLPPYLTYLPSVFPSRLVLLTRLPVRLYSSLSSAEQ